LGKLSLLSEDGTEIVPEVGTLGSEIYGTLHFCSGLRLRISLAQHSAESTVRIRVRWTPLHREARFSFGLVGISLLEQNPGKLHPGR
jgi:hypothetical protein